MVTSARAGGLAREVILVSSGPRIFAGGLAREVIRVNTAQARVGGVVREVLVNDRASARVSGVRREVLFADAPAQTLLRKSRWFLRVAAPMERDDEDEQDPWYPLSRPRPGLAPRGPKGRPYLMINS